MIRRLRYYGNNNSQLALNLITILAGRNGPKNEDPTPPVLHFSLLQFV